MASVRVRALAKINLDLRVLNKRPDGFHDLRTIFQTISLADTIEIAYQRGRTRIEARSNVEISDNLMVKAAERVLKATRSTGRIDMVLTKRIPMGAGLGGGSSDAAAVLLALPVLLKRAVPMEKLLEIAASLGSDVPFFLLGGTAVGLGRGTDLFPLPDLSGFPALLITPGIHVSTADAYSALDRPRGPEIDSAVLKDFEGVTWSIAQARPAADWAVENHFEQVVFPQYPQLKSIKGKLLKLGARPALMSGSGSTIFGIFLNRQLRDGAAMWFNREFGANKVQPVTLVSRSRYRALWQRRLDIPSDRMIWQSQPQDRYAK